MKRGCFIGRFQPFHSGHRQVVEDVSTGVDELVIGIGSAGISHTVSNPFTAGERIEMIASTLADLDVGVYPVPIEDVDRHALWVRHVESMCPSFDVVYSNNPLVVRLFSEAGHEVRQIPMHDRDALEGTQIRQAMLAGEEWEHLVPEAVASVINSVDGCSRIRDVNESDTEAD